jgi:tetraacyldisaccharide 4'-kinase
MRERLRAWTERLETFFLEVIVEERRGVREELVRGLLYACSKGFEAAIKTRRFLYNVRILRDSTLGVQVIAVGNLTVGGTGKTPVVEKLARELRDEGRNVAILSRGYRSKPAPFHLRLLNKILLRDDTTPPRVVSDGKSLLLDSEMAGDEPYMLASNLKDVVVLVDKDRVKSGRYAIEKFGCEAAGPAAGHRPGGLSAAIRHRAAAATRHSARAAVPPGARQHDLHHEERRQHRRPAPPHRPI